MDVERLFYLVHFEFLEKYGETYFINHPIEERGQNWIKKKISQKKNDWRMKKPYRQGMYAIQMSENRRKKRYPFDEPTKKIYMVFSSMVFIVWLIFCFLVIAGVITISTAEFACIGIIFFALNVIMSWDYKRYKDHHGKIVEIYEDMQESEEILHERSSLLLQIIQTDICDRGYSKKEIVDFFIRQCELEISNSRVNKTVDKTKNFIVPFLLGICFLESNRIIAMGVAFVVIAMSLWFIFEFEYSLRARIFKHSTREELCYRAVLDCLLYVKLRKTQSNNKPTLR